MRIALALIAAAALGLAACNINDYCINCGTGDDAGADDDGGTIDAATDDGGGPPDACIVNGNDEDCNGLDNDCDGTPDDGFDFGGACGTDEGECTAGVKDCLNGVASCSDVPGSAEECDDLDNDCDGNTDEGNPEGGADCGSDVGECQGGTTTCIGGGVLDCVGDIGTPGQDDEVCDGKDNDCDTFFDEDVATAGDCNFPAVGECVPGTLTCVGGDYLCVGGHGPSVELCDPPNPDEEDQDCDGNPHNGYNLNSDISNCGVCGHSCVGTITNATERCSGGGCEVASCDTDFHDDPTVAGNDCLYFCQFAGPVEACNQADDDCDHNIDENVAAPPICDQDGECAGTVATCTATGYACEYGPTVSTDANGDIEPETLCDGLDNDCDGVADDSFATLGDLCDGPGSGVCQDHGHIDCDPGDATAPPVCVIDDLGGTSSAELCDDLDNDCDGNTDENPSTLSSWVSIGGGRQIMKYEASRPDARTGAAGVKNTYACSRVGVQPWTMVTQPQAEAACALVGARLCSEQEWHRACSGLTGTTWPFAEPSAGTGDMFFEAEDYQALTARTPLVANGYDGVIRTWVPDFTAGYSGISAMRASPNTAANISIAQADAPAQAARLDYQITFGGTGAVAHHVWVRMYSPANADNQLRVGISTTPGTTAPAQAIQTSANNAWVWIRTTNPINVSPGVNYVSLYLREDGLKVDAIMVTRSTGTTPPTTTTGNGGDWSFASSPDVFVGGTCNGEENDTDPSTVGVDEDDILDTGSKAQCNAAGVFDLSGNVKEWTLERTPNANPFRGGASNNLYGGTMCSNAFSLGDDQFFFNNVGFRCCK